jgi:hypothetical protein
MSFALAAVVVAPAIAAAHGSHHEGHDDAPAESERTDDTTHVERHGNTELVVHDCSGRDEPTAQDEANAEELVDTVTTALEPYHDVEAAAEDGYTITDEAAQSHSPIDHYMRAVSTRRRGDPDRLRPNRPDGLVYFARDDGTQVLLGAVWRSRAECPPQPAGPLTVWHDHSPSGCPAAHPDCPAATGAPVDAAHVPKMFHVWIFDGAAEPFAHDLLGALGDHSGRRELPFESVDV